MWPFSVPGARQQGNMSVQATAAGSANTKGAWAQLTAGLGQIGSDGFTIVFSLQAAAETYLFDIGIGAAGSEQVIVANLGLSSGTSGNGVTTYYIHIPIPIAVGTRIAVRCQCTAASQGAVVAMRPYAMGRWFSSFRRGKATTYGANTADSGGVAVDPGAVANTKGAWSQIDAAIADPICGAILCTNADDPDNAFSDFFYGVDVGVGPAGSEVVIAADLQLQSTSAQDFFQPPIRFLPIVVKAGERLAVRAQCSGTTAGDRVFDAIIIGLS